MKTGDTNNQSKTNPNNSKDDVEIFEAVDYKMTSQRKNELLQEKAMAKDERSKSISINEQSRLSERWNSVVLDNNYKEFKQMSLKAELKKNSYSKEYTVP